ncbi:MAG: hypothetical protein LRZ99_01660 [Desulfotomaculum sp.]|nr:hypothetical protein [Desulfotomaculum sp.]MCL0080661.1 hypothetical protein [Peptococcaceae bacterium]
MYVDKKLTGVKAVQTLSRLNRVCPGKEDTFVLDFVNEPEDILKAFQPYYKDVVLNKDIDPNEIYTLERTIYEQQVINKEDVLRFTDVFYQHKRTKKDESIMRQLVTNSAARMQDFTREETLAFRSLIKKFINLYNLITLIAPIMDTGLHRLSDYLRYLLQKINIESPGGVNITDKVMLKYYRLEQKTAGNLGLAAGENDGIDIVLNIT